MRIRVLGAIALGAALALVSVLPVVPASGAGVTSAAKNDDFSSATLNTATWTFVNPSGTATQSMDGSHAVIGVPSGASHDPSTYPDAAPRLMQPLANVDFSVDAKFDSAVAQQFQEQGMVVEQDSTHYVHVDVVQNWYQTAFVVKAVSGSTVTTVANFEIYNKASIVLRVARTGNNWTFGYSYDGLHWTAAAALTLTLTVARAGVFGGNFGGSSSPAFTVKVDYFVNSTSPPATEDGVAWPIAPSAPVINIWYGSQQTFGANGQPQPWINILGDVSDPTGVASLTYTLNGGAANALSLGENQVRLVEPGEFNVELDAASLVTGANTVHLTAVDNLGNSSAADVTVTKIGGGPWVLPYTANWSQAGGNINSVAQVTDGRWTIQPDGTIHNADFGYDRLVTLGQASTWGQYDVTAQVTINSMDPDGSGVGIVAGWKGATNNLHGVVTADQPRIGHSFPDAFMYDNLQGQARRLEIYTNTDAHPEQTLAADPTATQLTMGVAYTYRFRVTDNASGGSDFKFKVWKTGTAEPSSWLIQASGELNRGSLVLVAHRADVNFGTVTVNPISGVSAPVNTAVPTISGTAQQGQTLSVSTGTWTNSPTGYTYAWNRCSSTCAVIAGANASSYTLTAADVGSTLTATVTATNAGGSSAPVISAATPAVLALGAVSQTIGAGTSATNLPTENAWPGAQNSPYICCWGSQGQYVTFSFAVAGGTTNLSLRYGAGNGIAYRKIELDGAVYAAKQAFPATANWSTWTTVLLPQANLAPGSHTLKVWFDAAAASSQYMNLDNLTVTQLTAAAVPVNTALPVITGTAQQGQTLSVSTGTWTNSPTGYAYAWNRCSPACTVIAGANANTYALTAAEVGSTITATVTASNVSGPGAPATSGATTIALAPATVSQTIAAGTSATNLPTETVWPGAQSSPYICCWGTQGQYVTFSFTVAAGTTTLALRYSAGNGIAYRKIELDGAVAIANQALPATANWSTWTTLTLSPVTLSAGTHTLKVWFDGTAGSSQYVNLDNLTVTSPAG